MSEQHNTPAAKPVGCKALDVFDAQEGHAPSPDRDLLAQKLLFAGSAWVHLLVAEGRAAQRFACVSCVHCAKAGCAKHRPPRPAAPLRQQLGPVLAPLPAHTPARL